MSDDQLPLFPEPVFDQFAAARQRDVGESRADRAQRVQQWRLIAEEWLREMPGGTEFTADTMIAAIGLPDGPTQGQNRNNVIGARLSAWSKSRAIVFTGRFHRSERPERHGNGQRVWRKAEGWSV